LPKKSCIFSAHPNLSTNNQQKNLKSLSVRSKWHRFPAAQSPVAVASWILKVYLIINNNNNINLTVPVFYFTIIFTTSK